MTEQHPKDTVFNGAFAEIINDLTQIKSNLQSKVSKSDGGGLPAPMPMFPPPILASGGSGMTAGSVAARIGTAAAGGILGMMPAAADAVDMQQALFQASLATGRHMGAGDFDRLSRMSQNILGDYQSSVGSAQRSAAILSNMGFNPYGAAGQNMLGQVGAMSLTTGLDNEQVSGILGSQSTNPVMTNRLRMLGFESFDSKGNPKDVASIADHLVKTVYGANPSADQIQMGLRPGGAMDLMLQSYIPDPGMQMLIKDAIFKRTANKGRYAANDAKTMKSLGFDNGNLNVRAAGLRYSSSESRKGNAFRNSLVNGYSAGLNLGAGMNDAFTSLAENAGILSDALQGLATVLSAYEGFTSTGPGSAVVGSVGALLKANGGYIDAVDVFDAIGAQKYVTGGEIVSLARKYVGKVPYIDSSTLPGGQQSASPQNGWDCATFTWWVLKQFGINAPDYTGDYEADTKPKQIPHGQEQPGDFILYRNGAHHIAIFAGGNTIIHAANSREDTVEQNTAFTGWYGPHYTKSIRYWDGGSQGVPNTPVPGDSTGAATTGGTTGSTGTTSQTPGTKPANNNAGSTGTSTLGTSSPAFLGVSVSVGLSGISAKAQSILQVITNSAPWASLGHVRNDDKPPAPSPAGVNSTSSGTTATGDGSGTYSGPSGKGPKWLKDFIKAHNVSEDVAKILWTIGMRETGGDPSEVYNPSGRVLDPKDSGAPHYDVGLYQVNNVHLDGIRAMFGASADMYTMKDPEKNWQFMKKLSNNFTKWTDWGISGITPTGFTHDFSGWGDSWQSGTKNYNTTVNNDAEWFSKYNQYSKGAWRIEDDQIAKIHENEMVLPAEVAEEVRHEWGHHQTDMTVHVAIGEASSKQAVRFAQVLKTELESKELTVAYG